MINKIKIRNSIDELAKVEALIDEIDKELNLSAELKMNIGLAVEETVSNIISYAYPEGTEASISITAECDPHEITFVISDKGREFDPTVLASPNIDINPAERELGGMGIFIVKNIMNTMTYQRLDGKNLLTMKKTIK